MSDWLLSIFLILTAECKVACIYEGYNTGFYLEKSKACACVNLLDHDALMKPFRARLNKEYEIKETYRSYLDED